MSDRDDNVILVGAMACGKSTVGWRLAKMIGFGFIDLDEWIERKTGRTITKIFDQDGEEVFREIEKGCNSRDFSREKPCYFGWWRRGDG